MTAVVEGLPLGDAQAARAEADVPRARRGDGRADDLRRRALLQTRRRRTTCRSAATSARPASRCRSSSSSSCRSGAAADHRARRGRHRRLREPQRHAEDDPHPLARARRDLRRQDARRRSATRSRSSSRWASSASSPAASRSGFHPLTSLSGTKVSPARARPARPRASRLRAAAGRGRRLRAAALDRHPKQRRLGRRDAHVRAADAAARCAARHREHPALPARRRSSTPGTASSAFRPTGRRSSARCGSARSTPSFRSSPPTSCSCAATSRETKDG